mgnify:FL=1
MTYARHNAMITAVIWAVVFAGVLLTVLLPGPGRFVSPEYSIWRLISAIIILPGFLVNAWLGWRSKRGKERGEMDERDAAVSRRAAQVTLFATTIAVFLAALFLYEGYYVAGAVPAGWLWLMAYGTVAFMSFVHAAAALVIDVTGATDA